MREIDRERNQRLQRKASPPCAAPSLEFVTFENKNQVMTAGRPLRRIIRLGSVTKFNEVTFFENKIK